MCAGLFKALGISAIETLIMKPSFVAITTGFIGGLGVALAKEHSQIITTLRAIATTLFRSLTPMLVIIVLSFLAALPFTGLAPLWNTKWASAVLLALLLLILLFVNAVFQDGEGARPYGPLLRRGVEATLISMPILVGLTIYSMSLRIAQHGFTPERYYAIVFAIVLGGYGLGYAWSVVRAGQLWLGGIRAHNIALSFVVIGLAFTLHIPLMDPLKRSADDQEQRFLTGKVDVARFDFGTMRFELGHYGRAVLDRLSLLTSHPQHQQIAEQLARLEKAKFKWEWTNPVAFVTPDEVLARLNVIPTNHTIPKDLLSIFQGGSTRYLFDGCTTDHRCDIVAGQWDEDPDLEYVLLNGCGHTETQCLGFTIALYDRVSSNVWKQVASIPVTSGTDQLSRAEVLLAAQEGRFVFSGAQYHCLTVGKSPKTCDSWGKQND